MLAATDTCPLEVSDGDEGICTYADTVVQDNTKESSIDSTAPILQVSNPEHMQPVRSVNREDGHDANALPETSIFRTLLKHSEATGSCVVTDVEPGDVEQNLSGLREVPEQIASSGRSSISSVSTEIYIGTASMFSEAEAASLSTLQVDDCLHADDSAFMEVNLHRQNSWDWTSQVDMKTVFDKCKKGSTKPPMTGISGLLSRSLLIGKTRDPLIAANESEPGWKLFGRVPPRGMPNRDPKAILKETHVGWVRAPHWSR
uniref:Uncharacterized protein n=1 Tax=Eptatretus burgeri TaxID=7764 RepID=A0A8C4N808_EPTBU